MHSELNEIPFNAADFSDNPEPRCPCLLLLDTSHSMQGAPIKALNRGLVAFKEELTADSLAAKRVEVSTVTFGGSVSVVSVFVTADAFLPTTLSATGDTPMGAAVERGLEMLGQRKNAYKSNGIALQTVGLSNN